MKSQKARRILSNTIIYIILGISAVIWVLPILWIVLQAFSGEVGSASEGHLIPRSFSFENFVLLFSTGAKPSWAGANYNSAHDAVHLWDPTNNIVMTGFSVWLINTLIIAVIVCVINTVFVLAVAYSLSRFRFKGRPMFMKLNLILGMFPGFLGMIINYNLMKYVFNLQGSIWALVILYSAGSGMGFFISKGFFDTVSKSIDEAAMIDGANRAQIFWNIVLPLAKPTVVYTLLTSFMAPWGDYITSSYIIGLQNSENWTVAIGLYKWATDGINYKPSYYTRYAAGSVIIALPLSALFLATQRYYVGGVTGGAVKG